MAKHDAGLLSQAQIAHCVPSLVGVRLSDNLVFDLVVPTCIFELPYLCRQCCSCLIFVFNVGLVSGPPSFECL